MNIVEKIEEYFKSTDPGEWDRSERLLKEAQYHLNALLEDNQELAEGFNPYGIKKSELPAGYRLMELEEYQEAHCFHETRFWKGNREWSCLGYWYGHQGRDSDNESTILCIQRPRKEPITAIKRSMIDSYQEDLRRMKGQL